MRLIFNIIINPGQDNCFTIFEPLAGPEDLPSVSAAFILALDFHRKLNLSKVIEIYSKHFKDINPDLNMNLYLKPEANAVPLNDVYDQFKANVESLDFGYKPVKIWNWEPSEDGNIELGVTLEN